MLNDYQDHDEKTDPAIMPPLLTAERLAELDSDAHNPIAEMCAEPGQQHMCHVPASELAALVRMYRALVSVENAQADAARIAAGMVKHLEDVEMQLDAFEAGGGRFEILKLWGTVGAGGIPATAHRWHVLPHTSGMLRWAGSLAEARAIVANEYPLSSGVEAHIVVQNVRI